MSVSAVATRCGFGGFTFFTTFGVVTALDVVAAFGVRSCGDVSDASAVCVGFGVVGTRDVDFGVDDLATGALRSALLTGLGAGIAATGGSSLGRMVPSGRTEIDFTFLA